MVLQLLHASQSTKSTILGGSEILIIKEECKCFMDMKKYNVLVDFLPQLPIFISYIEYEILKILLESD